MYPGVDGGSTMKAFSNQSNGPGSHFPHLEGSGECSRPASAQSRETHLRLQGRTEAIFNRQSAIGPTAIELSTRELRRTGAKSGEAHRRLAEEPGTSCPFFRKRKNGAGLQSCPIRCRMVSPRCVSAVVYYICTMYAQVPSPRTWPII